MVGVNIFMRVAKKVMVGWKYYGGSLIFSVGARGDAE